jgi:hypothetical protein
MSRGPPVSRGRRTAPRSGAGLRAAERAAEEPPGVAPRAPRSGTTCPRIICSARFTWERARLIHGRCSFHAKVARARARRWPRSPLRKPLAPQSILFASERVPRRVVRVSAYSALGPGLLAAGPAQNKLTPNRLARARFAQLAATPIAARTYSASAWSRRLNWASLPETSASRSLLSRNDAASDSMKTRAAPSTT